MGMEGTLVTGLGFSHLGVMGPGHRPTEFVAALSKGSAWRSALLGGGGIPYTLEFLSHSHSAITQQDRTGQW